MKCLILACEYLPTQGGIAFAAHRFARQMLLRGMSIHVCTDTATECSDRSGDFEGVPVNRYQIRGDSSVWQRPEGELREFLEFLDNYQPDCIVIHGWQGWPITQLPEFRKRQIPVVLQSHGFGAHKVSWNWRPPFGLKAWVGYLPLLLNLPNMIGTLEAFVVLDKKPTLAGSFDHWIARLFHPGNVVSIPNATDPIAPNQAGIFEEFPHLREKKIVLCVANYCDRKNQMFGLEVARITKDPAIHFVFIGGTANNYHEQLVRHCEAKGLENRVTLLHGKSRSFCESAITHCHLAMLTSKFEMQPLFLIEAMSCGKPWTSTLVGSVGELTGGAIIPMDVSAFGKEICSILDSKPRFEAMGKAGCRQWQMEFSPEKVYEKWMGLLLDINPRLTSRRSKS